MSKVANLTSPARADDIVRARISHKTKVAATAVLESFGLNTSDFIRISMTMLAKNKTLPAGIQAKRKITSDAIREGRQGKAKLKGYRDAKAMFADFKADDETHH